MPISVELSKRVEGEFFWFGRWPNALLDAVNEKKEEIFKKLTPSLFDSSTYGGYEDFTIDGEQFRVTFGATRQDIEHRTYTIDFVERL